MSSSSTSVIPNPYPSHCPYARTGSMPTYLREREKKMQVDGKFQLMLMEMEMGLISFSTVEIAVPIPTHASSILYTDAYNLWNEIVSLKKID